MNYGSYFRLNQSISRLENGVAVYDYIDLPAYFTSSEENLMSPKYPISVIITSSSVCFRLHYSSLKIEELDNLQNNDNNYPKYIYNIEDVDNADANFVKHGDNIKIAHMEEVILELPYVNDGSDKLSSTIKQIYNSQFPLADTRNENGKNSGGRFLKQKINYRYSSKHKPEGVEGDLYETMQKTTDQMPSYSSLWLMGLLKGEDGKKFYDLFDDGGNIVGFLRKILLDFMFDLKHSDVFLNSASYQQMYSGLMSDFYFSALMHKCEYYYYRDLVTREIVKVKTDKDKENIQTLYGDNLSKSEELWTQDIMNPVSEKYFEYPFRNTHKIKEEKESKQKTWIEKIRGGISDFAKGCKSPKNFIDKVLVKSHILEDNKLIKHDSWFAEPEEEMRRVCFPMDDEDDNNVKHICNAELMVNCLSVSNSKPLALIEYVTNNREKISRWFLRRYDFNDVCHLHLSRWANFVTFSLLLMSLFIFVGFDFKKLTELDFGPNNVRIVYYFGGCLLLTALFFGIKKRIAKKKNDLLHTYIKKNCERITVFTILLTILPIGLLLNDINIPLSNGYHVSFIIIAVLVVSLFFKSFRDRVVKPFLDWVGNSLEHITSYLHLLFPRLVASITTAWLTMSVGFDLYVAFFDRHVSRSTAGMILIIVFIFVMYELNRITPRSNIWKKLFRSVQLVTISYFISLVVGTVVINFLGQQYMDRGGAFDDEKETTFTIESLAMPIKGTVNEKTFGDMKECDQKRIMYRKNCGKDNCQSIRIIYIGKLEVFFMRDFLIMFSFITMFMGIFLQMFIFEDKKMTEF